MKTIKTLAIQIDDEAFVEQYKERLKQTGKSLKHYIIDLMKADISGESQATAESRPALEGVSALLTDPELKERFEGKLAERGIEVDDYLLDLIRADMHSADSHREKQYTAESKQAQTEPEQDIRDNSAGLDTQQGNGPDDIAPGEGEAPAPEPVPGLKDGGEAPEQNAAQGNAAAFQEVSGITNLFVKITKEQRESLEEIKNESGETVGKIINRLLDTFLTDVRGGTVDEGLQEVYEQYEANAGSCDTTCSAKIPTRHNQELFAYLEQTGRSRNVLMASLVHLELQAPAQTQGMGMQL